MCDEGRTGSLVCPRQVKNSAAFCIDKMILDERMWNHDGRLCWRYLCGTLIYTYGCAKQQAFIPPKTCT